MTLASFALSLSPLHYLPSLLHHLLLRVGRRRSLVLLLFCCAPRMMLRCVSVCPTGSVCCVLCVSSSRSLSLSVPLSRLAMCCAAAWSSAIVHPVQAISSVGSCFSCMCILFLVLLFSGRWSLSIAGQRSGRSNRAQLTPSIEYTSRTTSPLLIWCFPCSSFILCCRHSTARVGFSLLFCSFSLTLGDRFHGKSSRCSPVPLGLPPPPARSILSPVVFLSFCYACTTRW